MTIKGWKKGSSHVVMILDQDEFYFFRLALMKSKKDHWPGDGTCNGHAYTVVNEICRMSFDEWMGSPKMVSPGEGRADRITINLNGHDYTDFQDTLKVWKEEWDNDGDCIAIALAEEIVNAGWCDAHCKDI
jgi:hypothetical protein